MAGSRRLRARLLAVCAGLLFAIVLAEVAWRLLELRPLQEGQIVDSKGEVVPLARITSYLGRGDNAPESIGPRSRLTENLDLRFCYDGPRSAWHDRDGCVSVRTNSLGFRDDEFGALKPAGETRILAVGDSFTFGNGVAAEDVWVERLEARLRSDLGEVQVINAGFAAGDHQPGGYVDWIASDGLRLEPDLVVIGICLNDLGDVPMALPPPPVDAPWLGGASRLLLHLQQRRADRAWEAQTFPDARQLLQLVPEPWRATREGLARIRDLCAEKDVPLLLCVFPMLERLEEGRYPYLGLHLAIADFCAEEQLDCVDTLPAFMGRDARALWAHPTDQHPSPQGHELIAEALHAPVLERLRRR